MNDLLLTTLKKEEISLLIEGSVRKVLLENRSVTPSPEITRYLNITEASKLVNLAKSTLYSKSAKREIPFMKKGKQLYFDEAELIDWMKKGKKKTMDEIHSEAENYSLKRKFMK